MDVLVDILLSLLAQPSALLRDVVEHTFKAVAPAVSEASVVDMLRVVMARNADNRNAGGEGSDDEDGGPLGEHDEDEDGDDDDEEEVGGDDSDSKEEEPEVKADAEAMDLDFGGSESESESEESDDDTPFDEKRARRSRLRSSRPARSRIPMTTIRTRTRTPRTPWTTTPCLASTSSSVRRSSRGARISTARRT